MAGGNVAGRLREDLEGLPRSNFDVLTFGDLELGQRYIGFPRAGDNEGHGGFKGGAYIYVKISEKYRSDDGSNVVDNSRRCFDDVLTSTPLEMPVLKVR
jgi:hypothetical protein